jgi:hypothetical protein
MVSAARTAPLVMEKISYPKAMLPPALAITDTPTTAPEMATELP